MRSAIEAHTSSTHSGVAPAASAAVPAAWITGPSASGSLKGTPSSTRSPPASAHASPIARDSSSEGKASIRYGISAAVLPWFEKAAAIASGPASGTAEYLGEILVAASRQRDQIERRTVRVRQHPRQRVRRLERRHDPFEPSDELEGGNRLGVVHRVVRDAPRVAQERVLRTGAGVVEPRRDRVRLHARPLLALQPRRQRPVQDPARPGGERRTVAARVHALSPGLDSPDPHRRV